MLKIASFSLMLLIIVSISVIACENDREIDGNFWTFNRMDDGNSYHELMIKDDFRIGSSLVVELPCPNRHVDALQVQWGEQSKKIHAELIVSPGNRKLGEPVREDGRQTTWAIQSKAKALELSFVGNREGEARIRWLRVFYGVQQRNPESEPNENPNSEFSSDSDLPTIDIIQFPQGPAERNCRVISWDGDKFIVIVDRGDNRTIRRELTSDSIGYILFSARTVRATVLGKQIKITPKRFEKGKIYFDKSDGQNPRTKQEAEIHEFSDIQF